MFYSHDVLAARGQGSLAVVWLAATLGKQTTSKKLGRREVNSVNVVGACDFLTSPPEPLALRLSSNLMMGVARVYFHQTHFFYSDVSHVFLRLKRALAVAQTDDIDMPAPVARPELITLEAADSLFLPDRTRVVAEQGFDKSFGTPSVIRGSGRDSLLASSGDAGRGILMTPAPTPTVPGSGMTMIMIPGPDADRRMTPVTLGVSRTPTTRSAATRQTHHRLTDTHLTSSETHTTLSVLRAGTHGVDRISLSNYGTSVSGSGMDAQDGLLPAFDGIAGDDFDLFADFHGDPLGGEHHTREARIGELDHFDSFAGDNLAVNDGNAGGPFRLPARQPDAFFVPDMDIVNPMQQVAEGEGNGNAAVLGGAQFRTKPSLARKRALFDDAICLPDDAFAALSSGRTMTAAAATTTYSTTTTTMHVTTIASSQPSAYKLDRMLDRRFLSDILESNGMDEIPEALAVFWKTNVVAYFMDENGTRRKRPRQTHQTANADTGVRLIGSDINDMYGGYDTRPDPFDMGDDYNFQLDMDPRASLGEVGRAAQGAEMAVGVSPRRMLWHADSVTTGSGASAAARSSRRGHERPPSSIGDDIFGITDSARKSNEPLSSRIDPLDTFSNDDMNAIVSAGGGIGDPLTTDFDVIGMAHTERESAAFYAYVKTIAMEADTDTIHFFDIVEHIASRTAVSQAFFNVLDLATRGALKVVQSKPYGDIELIPLQ